MTPQTAQLMAQYNSWMNQRLYAAAATLPDEALTLDRGAFFGSILQTLNHLAVGDTIWLHRFAQHPHAAPLRTALQPFAQPQSLKDTIAPTLAGLQPYRDALDGVIEDWSQTLTTDHLATGLHYQNTSGAPQHKNMGALVQHFFNHQTHHRGQATTLLHQAQVNIGVTDLVALIPHLD